MNLGRQIESRSLTRRGRLERFILRLFTKEQHIP